MDDIFPMPRAEKKTNASQNGNLLKSNSVSLVWTAVPIIQIRPVFGKLSYENIKIPFPIISDLPWLYLQNISVFFVW